MHIAALVSGTNKCKWANVSYVAKELNAQNWGWRSVKGTCGGRAFFLGPSWGHNLHYSFLLPQIPFIYNNLKTPNRIYFSNEK